MTEQTRTQGEPCAPGQSAICLAKNSWPKTEVSTGHDAERKTGPKQQGAERPKDRSKYEQKYRGHGVIKSDPLVLSYRQRHRRVAKKVKAVTGQHESGADDDEVMLISQHRGEGRHRKPTHCAGQENAAKMARINIDKKEPERGV